MGAARNGSTRGPATFCALQPAARVPSHSEDGGDEAEIAGCYVVGRDGTAYRVGLAQGSEFSDHVLESQELHLYSRHRSFGPARLELVIDAAFSEVSGRSRVLRDRKTVWEGMLRSGDAWMYHTLANIEHHHFQRDSSHPRRRAYSLPGRGRVQL